ncbi:MAG: helix-turn-helix transcriptional regulator [Planctomycetota bacterium]
MTEISIAKLLGARIKALRKGMNLKRAEFARLVEMSEDAIGLIERGETSPRLENLYKMAAKLNMPLSKLINFDKEINQRSIKALRPLLTESQLYLKTKLPNQIRKIRNIAQNIFDHTISSRKK